MDKTALRTAAAKYGTPLYLFDLDAFTARAQRVRAAFGSHVQLCYSMKANPFVLRGLPDVFRWVEVCSPGELTICERLGIPPELAPLMLIRPISGSAALALGADLMREHGVDSLIGRTAAVMLGSSETTFYTISVYFGAAGIKRTRYAIPAALCADFVGFFCAALFTRLFFS